jgi:hypothetical protein
MCDYGLHRRIRMERNLSLYRRCGFHEIATRPHPTRSGGFLIDMEKTRRSRQVMQAKLIYYSEHLSPTCSSRAAGCLRARLNGQRQAWRQRQVGAVLQAPALPTFAPPPDAISCLGAFRPPVTGARG